MIMSEANQPANTTSECVREWHEALADTLVLLEYLGRQSDSRLQAQFDDTRGQLTSRTAVSAVPPCKSYAEFLTRLARIEGSQPVILELKQPRGEPAQLDDLSFLRWSRDFLAAVAAPTTVQSIELTRDYTAARAQRGLSAWWWRRPLIRAKSNWVKPPSGTETSDETSRSSKARSSPSKTARWLAECVCRLERRALIATIATLIISTYAMAGKFIIDQDQKALSSFMTTNQAIEANTLSLIQAAGWQEAHALAQNDDSTAQCLHVNETKYNADTATGLAIRPASASADSSVATQSSATTSSAVALVMQLLATCRQRQWELMKMVSENVRLKSWDSPFVEVPLVGLLIGWNNATVDNVGSLASDGFCRSVAHSYGERDPTTEPNRVGCATVVRLLVQDSASMATAILGCITLYMLPCLYAYLGAAAATMFSLRRKVDSSLLNYTDRGLITYNERLGLVFGAVIGLFAGYLTKTSETNGLALSALALLAGYNVPGVFAFLDELSNRVFRPTGRVATHQ
jgi:hypothetical protein